MQFVWQISCPPQLVCILFVVCFDQLLGAAHSQMLVEICFFNIFNAKKLEKEDKAIKLSQNLAKNVFVEFALVKGCIPRQKRFSYVKKCLQLQNIQKVCKFVKFLMFMKDRQTESWNLWCNISGYVDFFFGYIFLPPILLCSEGD